MKSVFYLSYQILFLISSIFQKKKKEKKTMQIEKPIEKHSRKFSIHIRNVASQDSIISRHNLF